MPNALYDHGRRRFLEGAINWLADDIRLVLVSSGYTVNLASHEFLSSIPTSARVATSGSFTGKTSTAGVADADDVLLTGVTGPQVVGIVIYRHTGNDSTAPLIAWIDTATGLPFTPSGGDVMIVWDNGPNRIFRL